MKSRLYIFILPLLFISAVVQAQSVRVDYDDVPLNDVLLDLNDRYRVQISIDPDIANRCLINIHRSFQSMDKAMEALAEYCSMAFVKIDGVYTFYPKAEEVREEPPEPPREKPQFLYQGVVVENSTDEPVPYALMQFGDRGIVADENGRFSFKSTNKPEQGLFRSLGYELSDTTLNPGATLKISLKPALYELEAVEIISS